MKIFSKKGCFWGVLANKGLMWNGISTAALKRYRPLEVMNKSPDGRITDMTLLSIPPANELTIRNARAQTQRPRGLG
jgi:hypothetical protein